MAEQSTIDGGSVRLEAWTELASGVVRVSVVAETAGEVGTTIVGVTQDGGRPETPSVSVDADSSVRLQRVKRIVSAHGGSLRANLVPGSGGRFDVVLPLVTPPSREDHDESRARQSAVDAVPAPAPSPGRGPDDATSVSPSDGLLELLGELGLEVDVAQPGQTAEELVLQRRPRLLVVDQRTTTPSAPSQGTSASEVPALRFDADRVWERLRRPSGRSHPDLLMLGPHGAVFRSQRLGTTQSQGGGLDSARLVEAIRSALSMPQDWVEAPCDVALVVSGLDVIRPRVLLVDDTPDNVTHLSLYLNMHGFAVRVATTAEDAIEAVRVSQPDIVLMDVQLPDMDGLEAIRRIRNRPASRDTAIVAVTALAAPDDRRRCFDAGADDYVSKPVKLRELLAKIQGLTNRGTAERAYYPEPA
jgi:CheY-like chemotaxis protein